MTPAQHRRARRCIESHVGALSDEAKDYPMTYEQIGKILGITKSGVQQVEARALRKLRKLGWRIKGYAP